MPEEKVMGLEKATFKELSTGDRETLENDIATPVSEKKEPLIAQMIGRNRRNIRKLVEAVNDNSKQGYGGMVADGAELVAQWILPQDWGKLGGKTETWGSWQGSQPSGVQDFFPSDGTFCTLGEEEGLIIFGFMNKTAEPVTDAVKFYKGTEESTVEPLPFRATHRMDCKDPDCVHQGGSIETPIVELRQPVLIPPETRFRIEHKKPVSGCDALQPIGFIIRKAEDAWDLSL